MTTTAAFRERARSLVLNVLVLDGLSILATALILRRWAPIATDIDPERLGTAFFGALFACFVAARVIQLLSSVVRIGRTSTEVRGRRYVRGRAGAAAVGWLALPLGLGYGLTVDPSLSGLVPFWVAAMLVGAIALPRERDLEGFDAPPSPEPEPDA